MRFGASKEQACGTTISVEKGEKTRYLALTMGTLFPKDPNPGGDAGW
jgi:hypothetical protein